MSQFYLEINDSDECRRTKTSSDRFNHFLDYFIEGVEELAIGEWDLI